MDKRTDVWYSVLMLATQDVQADEGRALGEELKQELHEIDVHLLRAADLAARYAATNHYDVAGYASPIDSIRFNCHSDLSTLTL